MDLPINKAEIKSAVAASKLRIGIVGAGLMGKWHARAAVKAGGEIICIADTDQNQAFQLASGYRKAQIFADAGQMLSQNSLDVLHICTPTASHQTIAELALGAGVNLFIEKPLAATAEETIQLYDLALENKAHLCPAHQMPFQKCVQKAKKMIPDIGRIIGLNATVCSAGGLGLANEYADSIASDILPHPLSLFQCFLNHRLSDIEWDVFRPQPGELRIYGNERDISLSISISMNARPTVNSFQIIGTKGTLYLDLFHDFVVFDRGRVSKARKIFHPFNLAIKTLSAASVNLARRTARSETAYPGLALLVNSFYHAINEDSASPISSEEAINIARIRDFIISR